MRALNAIGGADENIEQINFVQYSQGISKAKTFIKHRKIPLTNNTTHLCD